jgi:hypothetical protein
LNPVVERSVIFVVRLRDCNGATTTQEYAMPVGQDPSPLFQQFASPEKLVSADWVAEHLDDPSVVIVESDEDVLLYETGERSAGAGLPLPRALRRTAVTKGNLA